MVLSQFEEDFISLVQDILSSITMITCAFLIMLILFFQKYRFMTSRLVLYLSVASTWQGIWYLIPLPKDNIPLCDFQGFWITFGDWTVALWICIIAFNLHFTVIQRRDTSPFEKWYHIVVWGLSFLIAALPFTGGPTVYGPAGAWCWIANQYTAWRIGIWYAPLIAMFLYVAITYFLILRELFVIRRKGFYQTEAQEETRTKWRASMRLSRYPLIFVITWILPIINRVNDWVSNDETFVLVLLHTICISMQGTINSIVFCYDEKIFDNCTLPGLKARAEIVVSKEKRKTMELQPYELKHDDKEDDESPVEELPVQSPPPETVQLEEAV